MTWGGRQFASLLPPYLAYLANHCCGMGPGAEQERHVLRKVVCPIRILLARMVIQSLRRLRNALALVISARNSISLYPSFQKRRLRHQFNPSDQQIEHTVARMSEHDQNSVLHLARLYTRSCEL